MPGMCVLQTASGLSRAPFVLLFSLLEMLLWATYTDTPASFRTPPLSLHTPVQTLGRDLSLAENIRSPGAFRPSCVSQSYNGRAYKADRPRCYRYISW